MIYDEFTKNAACRDFKKYILENYLNHKFENENFLDFELSDDDIDLLRWFEMQKFNTLMRKTLLLLVLS